MLFADLSGFTSLSERLDPEDVKALAQRCAERMSEEVRRFGGNVVNVMGDAIMAVFGAPISHEDDAERAVRAALAIRSCQLLDPDGQRLLVHVGVNTGEVLAGQVGPRERQDYTVMGDTVNTAARLMSAAAGGSILVGEETYRATARVAAFRELAPIEAKGKQHLVRVWEPLEANPIPAGRPLGSTPLVGRDREMALLSGIWSRVTGNAEPHLISLIGEPGIGKTRLSAEIERQILHGAQVYHGRCLPYGEALGYWALANIVKPAALIDPSDDPRAAREKVGVQVRTSLQGDTGDVDEVDRHLALLSGLDMEADRSAAVDQRLLFASARRFLEALARRQPLCLIVEEIHWADNALLDLIEHVAARAKSAPLLLITQARPELLEKRPGWGGGVRAFTSLTLSPLDAVAASELALTLCREHELADDLAGQIGPGSGGNPLFAEELAATLAERGGRTGVPLAIKGLLSARLDALPAEERRLVQVAAVFGKVFWDGGARALDGVLQADRALDALEAKDLVREQRRAVDVARSIADPALFVRAAGLLLALEPDEALIQKAATAARAIIAELPGPELLAPFEAAEPVQVIRRLAPWMGVAGSASVHDEAAGDVHVLAGDVPGTV